MVTTATHQPHFWLQITFPLVCFCLKLGDPQIWSDYYFQHLRAPGFFKVDWVGCMTTHKSVLQQRETDRKQLMRNSSWSCPHPASTWDSGLTLPNSRDSSVTQLWEVRESFTKATLHTERTGKGAALGSICRTAFWAFSPICLSYPSGELSPCRKEGAF